MPMVTLLLTKFTTFYGAQGFTSVFTPLLPILTHNNPVHNLPYYLWGICFKITQPSTLQSHMWALPIRSSDENFVSISQLPQTCPTAPVILIFHDLDHFKNTKWRPTMKLLKVPVHPPFCFPLPLKYKYSPLYHNVKHPPYAHSSTPIQNYQ